MKKYKIFHPMKIVYTPTFTSVDTISDLILENLLDEIKKTKYLTYNRIIKAEENIIIFMMNKKSIIYDFLPLFALEKKYRIYKISRKMEDKIDNMLGRKIYCFGINISDNIIEKIDNIL
ncbi:hypothetical protein SLOPH_1028 [Spraguea lophii 42_110]|uniref:Uncharacterized protein n=1 Tax=Spraguea lophii (strain 42_110) TaxID=1358809 RepID=S7XI93_SPRLO|nr:hypothetical protein SLOPH_1028 [Spraguea lophii 42_110]